MGYDPNKHKKAAEWLKAAVAAQDWKCAICREPGRLVVDHNHITKKIRGLICASCNTSIRGFDDLAWIRAVYAYCKRETNLDYVGVMRDEFVRLGCRFRLNEIDRKNRAMDEARIEDAKNPEIKAELDTYLGGGK